MQAVTEPPRDTLTADAVTRLIRDSSALRVGYGAELLDQSLRVSQSLNDIFLGGEVGRESYADMHGRARMLFSSDLAWGRAIVRPYMTLSTATTTARFNLGAYYTNTPSRQLGQQPLVYDVECYDVLFGLSTSVGDSYSVSAGESYLTAIETILQSQGYTGYILDPARATTTLPSSMVWPLDENTTWLRIINDLLAAIGYRSIWSDWNGALRCVPYLAPAQRLAEWTYEVSGYQSMVAPDRVWTRDFFNTPNRWVAVRSSQLEGVTPTEGDGIYTYVNQYTGDTSVEARGRTITRVMSVEAADQAALVAKATEMIENDMRIPTKIEVKTAPNPLHWHFDRLLVNDPEIGLGTQVLESSWSLPLDGSDMTHSWSVIQ